MAEQHAGFLPVIALGRAQNAAQESEREGMWPQHTWRLSHARSPGSSQRSRSCSPCTTSQSGKGMGTIKPGNEKKKKKHRNKEIPYGEQLAKTSLCAHRQLDVPGQRNEAEPLGNDIKLTHFLLFYSIYPSPNSSDRTEPGRGAQVPPLCGCFAALGGTA